LENAFRKIEFHLLVNRSGRELRQLWGFIGHSYYKPVKGLALRLFQESRQLGGELASFLASDEGSRIKELEFFNSAKNMQEQT